MDDCMQIFYQVGGRCPAGRMADTVLVRVGERWLAAQVGSRHPSGAVNVDGPEPSGEHVLLDDLRAPQTLRLTRFEEIVAGHTRHRELLRIIAERATK